jgi:hypothetical protein
MKCSFTTENDGSYFLLQKKKNTYSRPSRISKIQLRSELMKILSFKLKLDVINS